MPRRICFDMYDERDGYWYADRNYNQPNYQPYNQPNYRTTSGMNQPIYRTTSGMNQPNYRTNSGMYQ